MKRTIAFVLSIVVLFGALVAVFIANYVSAYNYGNETEKAIEAKYDNNKNILSKYTMTIKEMAQVPDMYIDDLRTAVEADMQGRYGEDGSSGYLVRGTMLRIAGYPKIDLTKYKLVIADEVQVKFETGKDEVLQLRPHQNNQ